MDAVWLISSPAPPVQVILITTPTIMYLGFAMHKIARMEDTEYRVVRKPKKRMPIVNRGAVRDYEEAEDNGEEDPMIAEEIEQEKPDKTEKGKVELASSFPLVQTAASRWMSLVQGSEKKHDGRRRIQRDGLMKIYVCQLLWRSSFEIAFLFGQYILYGFEVMPSYVCTRSPCPHTVDCFVSRPTEKTIFLLVMYFVSFLCLLLTIFEMIHLGIGGVRDTFRKRALLNPRAPRPAAARSIPTAPPGYHATMKKEKLKGGLRDSPLGDSGRESFGDEGPSSRELERLRRHLKLAQQHLDLAYQVEESTPSRSSSPEVNTSAQTAAEQNRLNFAQEKQGETSEKGKRRAPDEVKLTTLSARTTGSVENTEQKPNDPAWS